MMKGYSTYPYRSIYTPSHRSLRTLISLWTTAATAYKVRFAQMVGEKDGLWRAPSLHDSFDLSKTATHALLDGLRLMRGVVSRHRKASSGCTPHQ